MTVLNYDQTESLVTRVKSLEPPVISLYLPGTPLSQDNAGELSSPQVEDTLCQLDVPRELAQRVLDALQARAAGATAIFANRDQCTTVCLPASPAESTRHIDATWGVPLMAPLHLLLCRPRSIVVSVSSQPRIFESFMDELEELEIESPIPGPSVLAQLAAQVHQVLRERRLEDLIVLGSEFDRSAFLEHLQPRFRDQVIDAETVPESPCQEADALLAYVRTIIAGAQSMRQRRYAGELLSHERTITGRRECARALAERRVDTLIAAWQLPLMDKEMLLQTAQRVATRLVFVESETGRHLLEKHGGTAARLR